MRISVSLVLRWTRARRPSLTARTPLRARLRARAARAGSSAGAGPPTGRGDTIAGVARGREGIGAILVRERGGPGQVTSDDARAACRERLARDLGALARLELLGDLLLDAGHERLHRRDQDRLRELVAL